MTHQALATVRRSVLWHRTIGVISFLSIALSGSKQIRGVGKVVFALLAPVVGEVALLSQKVIKLIEKNQPDLSNPTWYVGRR